MSRCQAAGNWTKLTHMSHRSRFEDIFFCPSEHHWECGVQGEKGLLRKESHYDSRSLNGHPCTKNAKNQIIINSNTPFKSVSDF